jgi:hypothetical protein
MELNKYNNICPVCGYNKFEKPPEIDDICPCCFFRFYVNDDDWSYEQLRADWIKDGAKWAWGKMPQPKFWDLEQQFKNINYIITDEDKKTIKYICPVCGFDGMTQSAANWNICPCCYTEFEYSDSGKRTHDELRQWWIKDDCKWHSKYRPQPSNWNIEKQLLNVPYKLTKEDKQNAKLPLKNLKEFYEYYNISEEEAQEIEREAELKKIELDKKIEEYRRNKK